MRSIPSWFKGKKMIRPSVNILMFCMLIFFIGQMFSSTHSAFTDHQTVDQAFSTAEDFCSDEKWAKNHGEMCSDNEETEDEIGSEEEDTTCASDGCKDDKEQDNKKGKDTKNSKGNSNSSDKGNEIKDDDPKLDKDVPVKEPENDTKGDTPDEAEGSDKPSDDVEEATDQTD